MNNAIRFSGRVLYLSQNPECIRRQMEGEDLTLESAGALRDNISTDEITPVTVMMVYDERLGEFPYVGFKAGEQLPIARNAVRNAGFEITVAGKRYGKGSSRESSPVAELSAGIRLIVAESFERIYQQNCDNIGILTTTDFSVLERIAAGEAIEFSTFLEGRDELTRQIIRCGGLLKYSRTARWPLPGRGIVMSSGRGQTLVEKIIARHVHPDAQTVTRGEGVFIAADFRFSHDYFTGMSAHLMHQAFGQPATLVDPGCIIAFEDHLVLAPQSIPHIQQGLLEGVADLARGHASFSQQYPVRSHGALKDKSGSEGICHALMIERYALPGQVVAGTDSHTPHSGALGCLAFGVGATEMANSWVTGYVRCKVPDTIRIEVSGLLAPGVMAKDLVLYLLQMESIRTGGAIGAVFEYAGPAIRAMSIDERATLTNMVAELGGMTGIVEPDEKTVAFLKERRDIDFELEDWMTSDPDAHYREVIRIDGTLLQPMLARPGDPGNGVAVADLPTPVKVDIAYGGSCTAGKRSDFDCYHEVLLWALENEYPFTADTRLFLQFGTMDVHEYCQQSGYLDTFEKAGVVLIKPGCGACANCGPGQSVSPEQVTISAINRNFPGRSGPGSVWLASPYTVAASAIAGSITTFAELQQTMAASSV